MNKHCTLSWYNQRVFNHVRMQGMENFEITVKSVQKRLKMHIFENVTNLFNKIHCAQYFTCSDCVKMSQDVAYPLSTVFRQNFCTVYRSQCWVRDEACN
jgi:hypothetical protein